MDFGTLVANLPAKKAAVYTFERGKITKIPYTALAQDIAQAVQNLKRWGAGPGSRIGIFAPNSCHWLVYDLAIIELGAISVPFTDDFTGKLDRAVLDQYQCCLLLVSQKGPFPVPEHEAHVAFIDGDNGDVRAIPRAPDSDGDALTMAFSSGSAGGLKGLLISRSGMEATLPPIVEAIGITPQDRLLLFMPMSNFQQRTLYYTSLWCDCDLVVTDYLQLPASLKQTEPTVLIAPPMYFQTLYTRFVNFPPAKKLAWKILFRLLGFLPGASLRRALASRLFSEIYEQFGGRMRVLVTGMAPIKADVAKFFGGLQLPLCESYGLVETGSLTYRPANSTKYGSVGKPLRGIHIEFAEDGEVIINRDKTLTTRYFQSSDGENERTFISPGRIATGDIGRLDDDGYLYLLGRKRELIITPGGYKLHPEIVEAELSGCPDIAQAAVFLKPGTATLVCVASLTNPEREVARGRVRDFVRGMRSTKAAPIAEVIFADAEFSTRNGMLRPNLKLDRRNIAARYNLA